jgi:nicotinamidase-related amidase
MATNALVIIDMQMDMQHRMEAGRDHVNPEAPERIADLVAAFRRKGLPVLHIRHADENPASPFHPEAPGYRAMPCAESLENEPVFVKRTSSGFASTDLADYLSENGIDDLIVTGAVAGFCVNSTVRAGSDLGFTMTVVRDAVLGFDMPSAHLSARSIFDVTMAHLESDFAKVVDAASLLAD